MSDNPTILGPSGMPMVKRDRSIDGIEVQATLNGETGLGGVVLILKGEEEKHIKLTYAEALQLGVTLIGKSDECRSLATAVRIMQELGHMPLEDCLTAWWQVGGVVRTQHEVVAKMQRETIAEARRQKAAAEAGVPQEESDAPGHSIN